MIQTAQTASVHVLTIPTAVALLVVPSATVAEVVNVSELLPQPGASDWCLGILNWRSHGIPIVSMERLMGLGDVLPGPRSKYIIFYPLPGRGTHEFFGVLTTAEPQPRSIVDDEVLSTGLPFESPFAAAGIQIGSLTGMVPDFEVMKRALYSGS